MAHKKAAGSTRNGRDSESKRLGARLPLQRPAPRPSVRQPRA